MNLNYNAWDRGRNSRLQKIESGGDNATTLRSKAARTTTWLVCFVMFFAIFAGQKSYSQAAGYTFSQTSGTYAPLAASGTPAANFTTTFDDNAVAFTIPFTFNFNGVPYTTVTASSNGFMVFGSNSSTNNAAGAAFVSGSDASGMYLNGNATNNGVAGFNVDMNSQNFATFTGARTSGSATVTAVSNFANLQVGMRLTGTGITSGTIISALNPGANTLTMSGNATSNSSAAITPSSSLMVIVSGTSPNQVVVVQYTGVRRYNAVTENISFQIRLNQANNVADNQTIDIRYGTVSTSSTGTAFNPQVGIRTTTADFNSRTSTSSWAATTASAANSERITFSNSVLPASGLTFTWTPPVLPTCVTPTVLASSTVYTAVTTTSLTGTFTAASPAPSKYLVVRSTSPTPPTPVDGTAYTVGATTLGTGTNVRLASNALTFTDSGLTAGTLYYYHIFLIMIFVPVLPFIVPRRTHQVNLHNVRQEPLLRPEALQQLMPAFHGLVQEHISWNMAQPDLRRELALQMEPVQLLLPQQQLLIRYRA